MKGLVDAQREYNMRKSKMMEMEDAYSDAYRAWDSYYRNNGIDSMASQRFGTSPVRDCYWKITPSTNNAFVVGDKVKIMTMDGKVRKTKVMPPEILVHYNPKLLSTPAPTMVFRRFGNLHHEEPLDLFTRSLLGLLEETGYKFAQGHAICNDAWTINLRKDNGMDAFLAGFSHKETNMVGIDIGDELKDLLKVYTDAEAHLGRKEKNALDALVNFMKTFIETHEERKKFSRKLENLKTKLSAGQKCEDCCHDDDEDEGDDDE